MVNPQDVFEDRIKKQMGDLQFEVIKYQTAIEVAHQRIQELEAELAKVNAPVQEPQ